MISSILRGFIRGTLPLALVLAPLAAQDEEAPAAPDLVVAGRALARVDAQANEHTASTQEAAALARASAGRTLVVWHSRRQQTAGSYGVYGRLYAPDGDPLTGEVQLNANEEGDQTRPAASAAPDGSFWIAWESFGADGDLGSIVARRFAPDLAQASPELLVPSEGRGHQIQPAVLALDDGGAVVAWTSLDPKTGLARVLARRFTPEGQALGEAFAADAPEDARDGYANLALVGDDLVVVWARATAEGVPTGILARRFSLEGEPRGAAFAANLEPGAHIEPTVAAADGVLLVGWLSGEQGDYHARLRRLTPAEDGGFAGGAVRTLATGSPGYLSGFDLALAASGEGLCAWSRFGDDGRFAGLFAQLLDAAGNPRGESFRVTGVSAHHQRLLPVSGARRVWLGDDSHMAFAWSGFAGGDDESAAALTLIAPEGDALAVAPAPAELLGHPDMLPPEEGAKPHEPPIRSTGRVIEPPAAPPTPGSGFTGFTQTGLTPPDPEIAVGPNHVVLIVNDGIRFYTKGGTLTFSGTISQPGGFFQPSGGQSGLVFDPEALYDPHSNRFFVMASQRASGGQSIFRVAVSDDSDPNGSWNHYAFNVTAAAGNDGSIDSPNFAVDATHVYLTADFFGGGDKFLVLSVEKAPMLSGGTPATASNLIFGSQSFGVPITYDATAPAQYMIQSFEAISNNTVRFWAMTDPTNPSNTQTFTLSVPTYGFPEDPPQMGTSVRPELFEPRFWSCLYINGSLWATHHVNSTRVRQRWYQFDMQGWPTSGMNPVLAQWGEVDPGDPIRTFFGSIAVDTNENVVLDCSRSSPSEFISMWYTTRTVGDPAGTTQPLTLAKASTSADFTGRWGDYSGIQVDPSRPGGFMAHGEYTTGTWRTWVEPVQVSLPPVFYCTPKASSSGCLATVTTSDPSVQPVSGANDYDLVVTNVQGLKNGLVFFGKNGPASTPFQGGTLCVTPPLGRMPVQFSGGVANTCFGILVQRINDPALNPNLDTGPGTSAWLQAWYRNPELMDGFDVALSDAVEVTYL